MPMELLFGDENEESFMISFLLVFFGAILCPSTSDIVDWTILYSLVDVSLINSYDWASFCLQRTVREIQKYKQKISKEKFKNAVYVGGCLPVMAVAYIDMLDLSSVESDYHLDYGVPRIFHVRASDFHHVLQLDSDSSSKDNAFEVLNFRDLSSTPYSDNAIKEANDIELKRHQLALLSLAGDSSCPGPSCQADVAENASCPGPSRQTDINSIIESIVQSHKAELLRDVQKMVSSRFSLMSAAIYSAVSQHVASCEANSANRVNPQKESVGCDEEKGEGTSGSPSQSTPVVGVSSSRIQQVEHAGTENVPPPVQQAAAKSVQPIEVNADGSQDVSVPSMSRPSIHRPIEVDPSAVVFVATRSCDDVVHADKVHDITKLTSSNIGEEVLEPCSNKDVFAREYGACTEAGEPELGGCKVNDISNKIKKFLMCTSHHPLTQ